MNQLIPPWYGGPYLCQYIYKQRYLNVQFMTSRNSTFIKSCVRNLRPFASRNISRASSWCEWQKEVITPSFFCFQLLLSFFFFFFFSVLQKDICYQRWAGDFLTLLRRTCWDMFATSFVRFRTFFNYYYFNVGRISKKKLITKKRFFALGVFIDLKSVEANQRFPRDKRKLKKIMCLINISQHQCQDNKSLSK